MSETPQPLIVNGSTQLITPSLVLPSGLYRPGLGRATPKRQAEQKTRPLSGEKIVAKLERIDQDIDLGAGVVHPEGRAAGRGEAQMIPVQC